MAYKKAGQYLTEAEWQVMECVWEKAPCTGREVWEWFQGRTTWSRSTPLTLLGRLENKGYVKAEKIGGRKQYTPLLTREDASLQEAKNLLQRAYQGSVTLMVNCQNKKEALPKEELDQLYELLKGLEDEDHA